MWLKKFQFRMADPEMITWKELRICDRLAALFKTEGEEKAPFWAFIKFLSLRRRPNLNPKLRRWIEEHYEGEFC